MSCASVGPAGKIGLQPREGGVRTTGWHFEPGCAGNEAPQVRRRGAGFGSRLRRFVRSCLELWFWCRDSRQRTRGGFRVDVREQGIDGKLLLGILCRRRRQRRRAFTGLKRGAGTLKKTCRHRHRHGDVSLRVWAGRSSKCQRRQGSRRSQLRLFASSVRVHPRAHLSRRRNQPILRRGFDRRRGSSL